MAINEGRDVFAIPGSIYAKSSQGCNHLIQQGAKLVQQPADIIEEYLKVFGEDGFVFDLRDYIKNDMIKSFIPNKALIIKKEDLVDMYK